MVEGGQPIYYSATKKYQVLAAISATMGAFALGTVLAWTATGTDSLKKDYAGKFGPGGSSPITDTQADLIGSFVPLGALFCGPPTGFLIGKLGRKPTMLLLSAPFVLGWLLLAFAENLPMILAGRIITGFFGGAFSLAAPVYIGEIAENSVRGLLGSGFQMMVVLGILFSYGVGAGVTYSWLSIICAVIPVICLAMMIFMPESPRWYVSVGKMEEAGKALAWFRGTKSTNDIQAELQDLQASVREAQSQTVTFGELLHPSLLKPTLVSLLLMLFQQLSGINAVIFYVTTIFEDSGSTIDKNVAAVIVGVVQVVATGVAVFMVDRAGRRILLIISDAGMALSLVALGIFFTLKEIDRSNNETTTVDNFGWLPLVSLMVFISSFSVGFGPIPWMLLGEILPPRAKGLASAIATSFNWTLAFLVAQFFGPIKEGIGIDWCYYSFAIICCIGTAYVILIVPETKGKSLDEIQALFGPPAAPRNMNGRDNKSYENEQ